MSAMTRYPLIVGAVATALTVAACGGAKTDNNASTKGDAAFDGALKFSRCMRQHGIDFPDPQRMGNGAIRVGGKVKGPPGARKTPLRNPDEDPKMKAAQAACGKYLKSGGGPPMDAATQAKARDAFVAYARCMRSKGINMPDPKVGSGGIMFRAGPGGVNPDSPVFKAADSSCHHFLAQIENSLQKGTAR
jgi:hypothetical protein